MKIIWTQLALFDLEEAREYIMATSPSDAIQTIDRIEKSLEALASFP
jgi:plasmid stabilization system protein ParE